MEDQFSTPGDAESVDVPFVPDLDFLAVLEEIGGVDAVFVARSPGRLVLRVRLL
jgi:hypothetical protein